MSNPREVRDSGRDPETKTIGVNPPKHMRPLFKRIADELGIPVSTLLYRSAEAIAGMIDAETPSVPRLVTAARTLRAHCATFTDPERPFAADVRVLRVAEDAPVYTSESQSNASAAAERNQHTRGKRGARAKAES